MPSPPIFLLNYAVALAKVLLGLAKGDSVAVIESASGGLDRGLTFWAAKLSASNVETVYQQVLDSVATLPEWEAREEELQSADAEASLTLTTCFTFESVAENIETPDRLPNIWSSTREGELPIRGSNIRALHDRLLAETARAVIPVLPDLPGFRSWHIGYLSRR